MNKHNIISPNASLFPLPKLPSRCDNIKLMNGNAKCIYRKSDGLERKENWNRFKYLLWCLAHLMCPVSGRLSHYNLMLRSPNPSHPLHVHISNYSICFCSRIFPSLDANLSHKSFVYKLHKHISQRVDKGLKVLKVERKKAFWIETTEKNWKKFYTSFIFKFI